MTPDPNDRTGIAIAAAAATGLGLAIAMSRYAYEGGTNGLTVASCRSVIGVLTLLAACRLTGRSVRLPWRDWMQCVGLGALMAMMFYGNVGAVEYIPVGLAALLFYTYPPMVGLIHALVLRERLPAEKVLALLLAFAGLGLMLGVSFGRTDPRGVLMSLAAATACAWNAVWVARRLAHVDAVVMTLHMATVGMVVLLVAMASTGTWRLPQTPAGWGGLWAVVALQCIAMPFYFVAIPRIGALKSAMISNVQPVASIVAAFVLFGELLTVVQFAGGAMVMAGILVMQRYDRRRAAAPA